MLVLLSYAILKPTIILPAGPSLFGELQADKRISTFILGRAGQRFAAISLLKKYYQIECFMTIQLHLKVPWSTQ